MSILRFAEGLAPWPSPSLAARPHRLAGARRRRMLAGCLERLLAAAERPPSGALSAAMAPCRIQVREARPELLGLADRLRGAEPVSAAGAARLLALLRDGDGPCYTYTEPAALARELTEIEAALGIAGAPAPDSHCFSRGLTPTAGAKSHI